MPTPPPAPKPEPGTFQTVRPTGQWAALPEVAASCKKTKNGRILAARRSEVLRRRRAGWTVAQVRRDLMANHGWSWAQVNSDVKWLDARGIR